MSDSEYKKIALLVTKKLSGEISDEELRELQDWRQKEYANELAYHKLHNSQHYKVWVASRKSIDVEQGWSNVLPEIKQKKKRIFLQRIVRIAAAIAFPLIIGAASYFYISNQLESRNVNRQKLVQIQPGSSKAVLTLDDGSQVVLDSMQSLTLTEVDGTQIEQKKGTINYNGTDAIKQENKQEDVLYNVINVPRGGEYMLSLADGTNVYLNSMSTLKYPVQFSDVIREVELTGEAYFEVAKNPNKPFIVNTKEMGVEVLGTSFNINAYDDSDNTVTTLVEGKIQLSHPEHWFDNKIMKPNEQAVMDNLTGKIGLRKVDISHYTGWKDGKFVFYDEPLEDIMRTLTRWYSAKVFYMNPDVKQIRFSGSLDKYNEISKFLDIIEATQLVNIEINNNTILFTEK